jgi:aminopeptidase N
VKIKVEYDSETNKVMVRIEQTQKHEATPEVFRFPFVIQVTNKDDSNQRFEELVNERIHTYYYNVQDEPKMIEIDPDYTVLMDASIEKPTEMWIHQLNHGTNVISRIKAAQALGKKATRQSIKALNKALTAESFWGVQVEIAKVLGTLKTTLALEGLLSAVNLKNSRSRSAVAKALGNFYQNDDAHKALVNLLLDTDSYFVVSNAATSIGKVKHEDALDILLKNLPTEDSSYLSIITRGFVNGLAALEKQEALEKILTYTEIGVADFVRREAITALGKLGKKFKKEHPEIKQYLIKTLLNDKSRRVQYSTLSAIKDLGDSSLIGTVKQFENMTCLNHYKRAAKVVIRSLSSKKDTSKLKSLQKSVEEIQKENRELKERMAKLESLIKNEK